MPGRGFEHQAKGFTLSHVYEAMFYFYNFAIGNSLLYRIKLLG